MPNGPLDIKTFELWSEEHQKYLDARFDKVCERIDSMVETRKCDIADCGECKEEIETKIKNTHKYIVVGIGICLIAAGVFHIPAVKAIAGIVLKVFF